jgi:hypothetical protein
VSITPFSVWGPYSVPTRKGRDGKLVDGKRLHQVWDESECETEVGVYIFVLQPRRGPPIPWYVGKTVCGFGQEAFNERNRSLYADAMKSQGASVPKVFFICQDNLTKTATARINDLEKKIINECFQVNEDLKNDRRITRPNYEILGVEKQSRGRRRNPVRDYLSMFGS